MKRRKICRSRRRRRRRRGVKRKVERRNWFCSKPEGIGEDFDEWKSRIVMS